MSLIDNIISNRLKDYTIDDYKFGEIKKLKDLVIKSNPDISLIDLGIGEPDRPADEKITKVLSSECGKKENRKYADNGILDFTVAASNYLKKIYKVDNIDPYTEILHGIGAKTILSYLPLCFIDKGDFIITTIPGYPILSTHTKYLGGKVYNLPLLKENNFLPDIKTVPSKIINSAKLFYVNYPNNPTGQTATKEFYEELIEFGYKNNILIISDLSYGPLVFNEDPISILSIKKSKNTCVEIHSLSKAFNMTGWRMAFIAGNKDAIKLYSKVKQNSDSGQFIPIQKAAIEALNSQNIIENNLIKYKRRMKNLINVLSSVGFDIIEPKGTFYCYSKAPKGTKNGTIFDTAKVASEYILKKAFISTIPWDDAGAYLRFSVTYESNTIKDEITLMKEIKKRLDSLNLIF